jgi:uncharacterized protein (TIGR02646 family)
MRYIDKTVNKAPDVYTRGLKGKALDKASILAGLQGTRNGDSLFRSVKHTWQFRDIFKRSLIREQGYVCCYCGCSIVFDNVTIEHVLPKGKYRHLVGEYENLLVSCEGGRDIPQNPATGVPLYERDFYLQHCDASKGENEIPIKPYDKDCESRFTYEIDGKISYDPADTDAWTTISVLQLDSPYLEQSRKDEIENAIYDGEGKMLSPDELEKQFDRMMSKDRLGHYHTFHFVVASVILGLF